MQLKTHPLAGLFQSAMLTVHMPQYSVMALLASAGVQIEMERKFLTPEFVGNQSVSFHQEIDF